MKKYVYENTVKQQADVICYAFSPALLDASEKKLKEFLGVLSRHFPKTDNGGGGYKPMNNPELLNNFNSAHRHVCDLISERREKKRYRWLLFASIGTFLVLVVTLGHRIYVQNQAGYVAEKALNQSIQPTADAPAD